MEKDPALAAELQGGRPRGPDGRRGRHPRPRLGRAAEEQRRRPRAVSRHREPALLDLDADSLSSCSNSGDIVRKAVFLVQREVAERFVAGPGGKDYAPLGILLQIYFAVKILFKVAPGSFVPPPKVESAVVRLERREAPLVEVGDYDRFRRFLHACFAQRRKTLANNLAAAGLPARRASPPPWLRSASTPASGPSRSRSPT